MLRVDLGPPGEGLEVLGQVRDVLSLEISGLGDVEAAAEDGSQILPQNRLHLARSPQVKGSLAPLRIGVLAAVEAAVRVEQVAQQILDRLPRRLREEVTAARLEGLQAGKDQQRLIVKHLFEVGDKPLLVDRVAVQAEAELVVDPAQANGLQGLQGHRPCRFFAAAPPVTQ